MEIILLFVGAILGGCISWYISKYWSDKSSKEVPEWVEANLVKSIKHVLIKRPDDVEWTSQQIVELYKQSLYKGSNDPSISDVNHCAECGSKKLYFHFFRVYGGKVYSLFCSECNWKFLDKREDIPDEELSLIRKTYERYEGEGHHHESYYKIH